ncbi:hypothetical protein DV515_00004670 [Chloebia gouldiae]|uniref:Uncharacterized protein n=1 Tax=Chloebia gouldiae TaxID=44316 RepID=A0A3L8SQB5_CHLGU|nr:hypothetical protein DV515_00004670 [Chloebia gouldiae]
MGALSVAGQLGEGTKAPSPAGTPRGHRVKAGKGPQALGIAVEAERGLSPPAARSLSPFPCRRSSRPHGAALGTVTHLWLRPGLCSGSPCPGGTGSASPSQAASPFRGRARCQGSSEQLCRDQACPGQLSSAPSGQLVIPQACELGLCSGRIREQGALSSLEKGLGAPGGGRWRQNVGWKVSWKFTERHCPRWGHRDSPARAAHPVRHLPGLRMDGHGGRGRSCGDKGLCLLHTWESGDTEPFRSFPQAQPAAFPRERRSWNC